jgi:hypothetical protein
MLFYRLNSRLFLNTSIVRIPNIVDLKIKLEIYTIL